MAINSLLQSVQIEATLPGSGMSLAPSSDPAQYCAGEGIKTLRSEKQFSAFS